MRPPVSKTCQFFADYQNFANLQRSRSAASVKPEMSVISRPCLTFQATASEAPNFGKPNNFMSSLARAIAWDDHFLPGPSDAFHSYFNGSEEYELRFYSNSYDSFLWSGCWQQFVHAAREKSVNSRMKSLAQLTREVVCRSWDVYVDQGSFG